MFLQGRFKPRRRFTQLESRYSTWPGANSWPLHTRSQAGLNRGRTLPKYYRWKKPLARNTRADSIGVSPSISCFRSYTAWSDVSVDTDEGESRGMSWPPTSAQYTSKNWYVIIFFMKWLEETFAFGSHKLAKPLLRWSDSRARMHEHRHNR